MIPLQLELTNFLSYRETAVLSFDGIHLACISGANGAGKSSILDAITWTLFGRSRSRSDDDLVNRIAAIRGEGAEVRYTFSLENSQYRVLRQKNIGKSGLLELQISTGTDSWKTLSENRIRETQAAIENLLRMNFDTFTNASFLLQGKADEFTTRTPNQRKEILADLLGVTVWEIYRERAAQARKNDEGRSDFLDNRLEEISEELAEKPQREKALEDAQARRADIAKKLELQEKLLNQMRQTSAAVEQQESLVASLRKSAERIRRNLDQSRQTYGQRQAERDAYQAIIDDAPAITAKFAAWQAADVEAHRWQEKADKYNHLLQAKRPFDLTIAREQSRLEQQLRQLEIQEEQAASARAQRPIVLDKLQTNEARLLEVNDSLQKLALAQEEFHSAREVLQNSLSERRLLQQELEQLQATESQVQQLEAERVTVSENKAAAEKRIQSLDSELDALAEQHTLFIGFKAELDSITMQQPLLRKEMDKLRDRIDRLAQTEQGACPLCGQPLTEQHRQEIIDELKADGKERGDVWRTNSERLSELKNELPKLEADLKQKPVLERERKAQEQRLAQADARLDEVDNRVHQWKKRDKARLLEIEDKLAEDTEFRKQENRVSDLEKQLQPKSELQTEQRELQSQIAAVNARKTMIDRLVFEWESEGQEKLATVRQQLAQEDFAGEAREAATELQDKIDQVGYDPAAHQQSKDKKNALAAAEISLQRLRQAEAAAKPLEDTLSDLRQRIQEQEAELVNLGEQLQIAEAQLATLKVGVVDMRQTEDQVFQLREEEIAANRQVGAAEQRLAVLDELRSQSEQLKQEKTAVSLRIQRLKLLEKSCSRSGVQALLIEQALPEIEERANELLDRLTGGDMSIFFETQRKLKTRDALSETLDIRIIDKDGERPYDNYSGGEQFRVNFAIRIALSQLLAKRAGARLQTLIIDEGFGSQDPQGRQRLIEAINTVSDEFACILVITHIDELRDAFPARIEVTKTFNGSDIKIS